MSSERLWVCLLALTFFLTGLAAGVLIAPGLSSERQRAAWERPWGDYEARLTEDFDLDEERVRILRKALADYDEELERLKAEGVRALEPGRRDAGGRCLDRIRRYVIPPDQLIEFDRRAQGLSDLEENLASSG